MDTIIQNHTMKSHIRQFILSNFMPNHREEDLHNNDLLFESGIVDSAGAMMLIAFIEERFDIKVPDEELFPENFATVEHIMKYLEMKLRQRKPEGRKENT